MLLITDPRLLLFTNHNSSFAINTRFILNLSDICSMNKVLFFVLFNVYTSYKFLYLKDYGLLYQILCHAQPFWMRIFFSLSLCRTFNVQYFGCCCCCSFAFWNKQHFVCRRFELVVSHRTSQLNLFQIHFMRFIRSVLWILFFPFLFFVFVDKRCRFCVFISWMQMYK